MSEGKARILIIDDQPSEVKMVRMALEAAGYEVVHAYNGTEGLEKAGSESPDLIILDVMMPEKDGYAVCKELKRSDELCNIPVILLTAVASHVTSTRYSHADGMTTEADDYIAKPASAADITRSLKRLLAME